MAFRFLLQRMKRISGFIVERDRRQKIIDITGHSSIQMKVLERLQDISKIIVLSAGARDEKMQAIAASLIMLQTLQ